ncbi:MAG: LamB/YcsF family protein [Pirellulales bacterium]
MTSRSLENARSLSQHNLSCGSAPPNAAAAVIWPARGGIDVPPVLSSRSTDVRGGFGGLEGRTPRAGDRLTTSPMESVDSKNVPRIVLPDLPSFSTSAGPTAHIVRVLPGPQTEWFTSASVAAFYSAEFLIGQNSDRMGYRLAGPRLELTHSRELASEAAMFGAIQIPHVGAPILLAADHPTTGGYPKIAVAISADRSIVAQAKPGDSLRFVETTLGEARRVAARTRSRAARAIPRDRPCLEGVAMNDTRSIDLNADLGEEVSEVGFVCDAAIMAYVSSINVACGVHAGDEKTMHAAIRAGKIAGVAIGDHPGLSDRDGMGRREVQLDPADAYRLVFDQVAACLARSPGKKTR